MKNFFGGPAASPSGDQLGRPNARERPPRTGSQRESRSRDRQSPVFSPSSPRFFGGPAASRGGDQLGGPNAREPRTGSQRKSRSRERESSADGRQPVFSPSSPRFFGGPAASRSGDQLGGPNARERPPRTGSQRKSQSRERQTTDTRSPMAGAPVNVEWYTGE